MIKKRLKKIYKFIIYNFFFIIYKKPNLYLKKFRELSYKIFTIKINNNKYYLFNITKGRIYTNRIDDTAYILDDYLLKGPSFQYRNGINSPIENNIINKKHAAVAQLVRALVCGTRCRWFESTQLYQINE